MTGQAWQQGAEGGASVGDGEAKVNPETGDGIPAWQFRIDGRLLEVRPSLTVRPSRIDFAQIPNQRAKDRVPPRKFSTLIKQMVVELDRDMHLYPEGNIVEVSCDLPIVEC